MAEAEDERWLRDFLRAVMDHLNIKKKKHITKKHIGRRNSTLSTS